MNQLLSAYKSMRERVCCVSANQDRQRDSAPGRGRGFLSSPGADQVVSVVKDVVRGWASDRIKLERAALEAKEHGALLVAESASRFLRSFLGVNVVPRAFEFERLLELVRGVRLATLHHPDTAWQQERGYQSKRGQLAAGNRGGRPAANGPGWKKRRRDAKAPEALRLHEQGKGYRTIAKALGVPWSTVRDWIE